MMNDPATSPADPGLSREVEILEYGKPCISEDGPIERGAEYRELCRTRGFPVDLRPLCRPEHIGPGRPEHLQPLLREAHHATVLQPVAYEGGVIPVLSRTRVRQEDPRQEHGRRFWMSRYAAFTSGWVDPFDAFSTMDVRPLVGLTRRSAESIDRAMEIARPTPPRPTRRAGAFLAEAVPLVASGVPVGIVGPLAESKFFEWASVLWRLLPPTLQALFSAGWCVAPRRAGSLTMSAAASYPDTVATFDPDTRQWSLPAAICLVSPDGRATTRAFSRRHRVPGTSFARVHLGWSPAHRPLTPPSISTAARQSASAAMARFAGPPRALGMAAPDVLHTLCYPAHRALDRLRVSEVDRWLAGLSPAGSTLCVDTGIYRFADMAEQVFDAGLRALGDPSIQDRGDLVVARSLGSRYGSAHLEAVARFGGAGRARADLHVVARQGSPRKAAAAMDRAIDAGEAGALPADAREPLFDLLDVALTAVPGGRWTRRIVDLLLQGTLPGLIRDWVVDRPALLTAAVARDDARRAALALAQVRAVVDSAFVDLVIVWCTGGAPDRSSAATLAGQDDAVRRLFGEVVVRAWQRCDEPRADHRSALLPWVDLFEEMDTQDSLLNLHNGQEDLPLRQARQLAREVVAGAVPPELQTAVSAVALRQFGDFRDSIREHADSWAPYLACWPPRLYLALLRRRPCAPSAPVDPQIQAAARSARPARALLKKVVRQWTAPDLAADLSEVAGLLWNWCTTTDPSRQGARDLLHVCADVHLERVPLKPPRNEADLDRVAHLAHAAQALPPHACPALLAQCRHGWQVRLVLGLFPDLDIELQPSQLELLVQRRSWLRRHLANPANHPDRRLRLGLAAHGFHKLVYGSTEDRPLWLDGIEHTTLWAVFSGVPPRRQGDLRKAIEAYASTPRQRCRLGQHYLDGQRRGGPEAFEAAQDAVTRHVIAPAALEANLDPKTLKQIFRVLEEGPPANEPSLWRRRRPRRVYLSDLGADERAAVFDSESEVRVARWFCTALEAVGGPPRSSRLIRIFRDAGGNAPT